MTRAAAEAGAHIYFEKPIATTLEEADQMAAAVETHNVRTAAAHHMRLVPSVLHLKTLISEGLIGELLEMRCRGKEDSRAGGEDLMILGWHCCYLMRFFAGEPSWCSARVLQGGEEITRADRREATVPLGPIAGDSIHASYAFPGGVQGHFSSQRQHGTKGSDFQIVLYGSKGVAQIHIAAEPRLYYLPDPLWSPGKSGAAWQPLPGRSITANLAGATAEATNNTRLIQDLLKAIQTGGQSVASLYEARAVLEMIMAVYESHLSGARATFPMRKRTHPLLG
jgi:predicted dehydrogenase